MQKSIKIMSILICISLPMCTETVLTDEIAVDNTVMLTADEMAVVAEKKELRAAHLHEDIQSALTKQGITAAERKTKVDELYIALTSKVNSAKEQSDIVKQLEDLGVYVLESSLTSATSHPNKAMSVRSSTQYLEWRSVVVSYDSLNDTWILGAGGNWNAENEWVNDIPQNDISFPSVGTEVDIGGLDGIGIKLYNTFCDDNHTYYPTVLVDSYAYISDGLGNYEYTITPTAGIDPADGVFFPYQDYATCTETGINASGIYSQWTYYGRNFSVFAEYSSEFEYYHGYASINYVHTWNNTGIRIADAEISTNPKFSIEFYNDGDDFSVTSNSNTIF